MFKEYTMKLFLSILIVTIFSIAMAQENNLTIELQKIQNTDNWEFNLNYEFNNSASNGILIELPSNFKVSPTSIRISEQEMWLKNSDEPCDNDSVIHWENIDDGLIIRFAEDVIQPTTQLSVKCIAQKSASIDEDTIVSIKQMINNDQVSDNVIASNNLNIIR